MAFEKPTIEQPMDATSMTKEQLESELKKAYRAIRGFWNAASNLRLPDSAMLAYHGPTIAAAIRFVDQGHFDGSAYFIGKDVSVLQESLGISKGS